MQKGRMSDVLRSDVGNIGVDLVGGAGIFIDVLHWQSHNHASSVVVSYPFSLNPAGRVRLYQGGERGVQLPRSAIAPKLSRSCTSDICASGLNISPP